MHLTDTDNLTLKVMFTLSDYVGETPYNPKFVR